MTVSELHVLDDTGDTRIEWNPNVPAEVEMARDAFDKAKAKRYLTYKVRADGTRGELLRSFDPTAEKIICAPQTVGG